MNVARRFPVLLTLFREDWRGEKLPWSIIVWFCALITFAGLTAIPSLIDYEYSLYARYLLLGIQCWLVAAIVVRANRRFSHDEANGRIDFLRRSSIGNRAILLSLVIGANIREFVGMLATLVLACLVGTSIDFLRLQVTISLAGFASAFLTISRRLSPLTRIDLFTLVIGVPPLLLFPFVGFRTSLKSMSDAASVGFGGWATSVVLWTVILLACLFLWHDVGKSHSLAHAHRRRWNFRLSAAPLLCVLTLILGKAGPDTYALAMPLLLGIVFVASEVTANERQPRASTPTSPAMIRLWLISSFMIGLVILNVGTWFGQSAQSPSTTAVVSGSVIAGTCARMAAYLSLSGIAAAIRPMSPLKRRLTTLLLCGIIIELAGLFLEEVGREADFWPIRVFGNSMSTAGHCVSATYLLDASYLSANSAVGLADMAWNVLIPAAVAILTAMGLGLASSLCSRLLSPAADSAKTTHLLVPAHRRQKPGFRWISRLSPLLALYALTDLRMSFDKSLIREFLEILIFVTFLGFLLIIGLAYFTMDEFDNLLPERVVWLGCTTSSMLFFGFGVGASVKWFGDDYETAVAYWLSTAMRPWQVVCGYVIGLSTTSLLLGLTLTGVAFCIGIATAPISTVAFIHVLALSALAVFNSLCLLIFTAFLRIDRRFGAKGTVATFLCHILPFVMLCVSISDVWEFHRTPMALISSAWSHFMSAMNPDGLLSDPDHIVAWELTCALGVASMLVCLGAFMMTLHLLRWRNGRTTRGFELFMVPISMVLLVCCGSSLELGLAAFAKTGLHAVLVATVFGIYLVTANLRQTQGRLTSPSANPGWLGSGLVVATVVVSAWVCVRAPTGGMIVVLYFALAGLLIVLRGRFYLFCLRINMKAESAVKRYFTVPVYVVVEMLIPLSIVLVSSSTVSMLMATGFETRIALSTVIPDEVGALVDDTSGSALDFTSWGISAICVLPHIAISLIGSRIMRSWERRIDRAPSRSSGVVTATSLR